MNSEASENKRTKILDRFHKNLNRVLASVSKEIRFIPKTDESELDSLDEPKLRAVDAMLLVAIEERTGIKPKPFTVSVKDGGYELCDLDRAIELVEKSWPSELSGLPDKGNPALLAGKTRVTVRTAARYGHVTVRAIEKAIANEKLSAEGRGPNRRIPVEALRKYFPQEK